MSDNRAEQELRGTVLQKGLKASFLLNAVLFLCNCI